MDDPALGLGQSLQWSQAAKPPEAGGILMSDDQD